MPFGQIRVHLELGKADAQNAAVETHGICGVAAEIHEDLVDWRRIGQDERGSSLDVLDDLDVLRNGRSEELQALSDDGAEFDGFPLLLLPAANVVICFTSSFPLLAASTTSLNVATRRSLRSRP